MVDFSSGFVGLGAALADKTKDFFTQNQQTVPSQKPVNSSSFSFDFSGALNKVLQPFREAADPRSAAGSQVILTAGNSVSEILRAGTDKVTSILRGSNTKPQSQDTSIMPGSAFSSGAGSIGELLAALTRSKTQEPSLPLSSSVAAEAAAASRNSVVLVAGAALILVFLSASKAR